MEELAKANNIALPAGLIQDGQVLGIPPYPACCLTPAKCAAAPAPAPVPAAPETGLQVDLKLSGELSSSGGEGAWGLGVGWLLTVPPRQGKYKYI